MNLSLTAITLNERKLKRRIDNQAFKIIREGSLSVNLKKIASITLRVWRHFFVIMVKTEGLIRSEILINTD